MLLRSAALLALTALAAGCDSADPAPDLFEATFQGDVQKTVTGVYGYTLLTRYIGLGSGDSFNIGLRTAPSASGESGYLYIADFSPDSVDSVTMSFSEAAVPEGTYQIGGQPFVRASFNVNRQHYEVRSGTITVDQQRGRLVGAFQFTDAFVLAEGGGLAHITVDGRFEVETGL